MLNTDNIKSFYSNSAKSISLRLVRVKSGLNALKTFIVKFGLYFIPSVVLLLSGVCSYFDRALLPSMISVAICSLGALAILITYKFLVVYTMAKDVMSKVDTHVVFQSRNQSPVPTQILDLLDDEDVDPSGQGYH